MVDIETGIFDLLDDLDLEETCDTSYEKDVDLEIIHGLYYQNVAFMNNKVGLFADYWIKLYSNCCQPRDYAVDLLNDNKVEEAKASLKDWSDTFESPALPQLFLWHLRAKELSPKAQKKTLCALKPERVVKRITFDHSEANPG